MNLKMGGINNEPSKEDLKDKIHSETMVCRYRYDPFEVLILLFHRLWELMLPTLHLEMVTVPPRLAQSGAQIASLRVTVQ